ncbi:MAG: hypothetical protein AB8Y22_02140 [Coxiella-like endosymbiont]
MESLAAEAGGAVSLSSLVSDETKKGQYIESSAFVHFLSHCLSLVSFVHWQIL